jgi:phosphoribosylanthranilate isomerase
VKNVAPTLSASRDSLPPGGADFPGGGPAENVAPTLSASQASVNSLPLAWGGAARRPASLGIPSARTRVKICGLTRAEDVDAAAAAGADAVGFVLYKHSARCVTPERAAELAARLPPFITPVLLFVNPTAAEVTAAGARIPLALLQFHGDETAEFCLQAGRPFMRAARIPLDQNTGAPAGRFDLVKYAETFSAAQAILLDAHVDGFGGGGKTFNWSLLPQSVNAHLVLSGGLTPANVIDGILQVRPRCKTLAVDVSSGVEVSLSGGATLKGIKSFEKINQFISAVRAADEQLAKNPSHHVRVPAT